MRPVIRHGFTLIEVLIAVAIGLILVASLWSVFGQVMQAARRNQAITTLHLEASAIHMAMDNAIATMFHGSQVRLAYTPPTAGNPDAQIDFDFMSSDRSWKRLSYRTGSNGFGPPRLSMATQDTWYRLTATAPQSMSGLANTTIGTTGYPTWTAGEDIVPTSSGSANIKMWIMPEVRRDRRRDMNDNDLRLLRNAPPAFLASVKEEADPTAPVGDGNRLATRGALISSHVSRFRLEIVDFRGYRTVANVTPGSYDDGTAPPLGISYYDADGNEKTPPSPSGSITSPNFQNVWTSSLRVLDGIWSDGRDAPCSIDGISPVPLYPDYNGTARLPTPAVERPAIVRIAFTLNLPLSTAPPPQNTGPYDCIEFDKKRSGGNTYVSRDFSFSFTTSSLNARP
jgi:prepilin-type N-terminal cleavage/methylation domain-containing protein